MREEILKMRIQEQYYVFDGGERKGPFSIGQLTAMWSSGAVNAGMWYWNEDASEWCSIADLNVLLTPKIKNADAQPPLGKSASFFIHRDGQEHGPYTQAQLEGFIIDRSLVAEDYCRSDTDTQWSSVAVCLSNIKSTSISKRDAIEKSSPTPQLPPLNTPEKAAAEPIHSAQVHLVEPVKKKMGCFRCGCLGVMIILALLVILIGGAAIVGSLLPDPNLSLTITGTTATCQFKINSLDSPQLAGETVAEEIYKIASSHPQLTAIDMELELSVPGGLVDKYGNAVNGPYIMGNLHIDDLGEVRRYASAGDFGVSSQDVYEAKIMGLNYADQLKTDR